ncbi:hypothetical protein CLU79DRAFT_738159, partial [Phycomyces nitens]
MGLAHDVEYCDGNMTLKISEKKSHPSIPSIVSTLSCVSSRLVLSKKKIDMLENKPTLLG